MTLEISSYIQESQLPSNPTALTPFDPYQEPKSLIKHFVVDQHEEISISKMTSRHLLRLTTYHGSLYN
jgi:hypothetical protein